MFSRVYIFIDSVQAVYDHAVGVVRETADAAVTEVAALAIKGGQFVAKIARDIVKTAELAVDGVFKTIRG